MLCARELDELHRWKFRPAEARQWFATFPEITEALEYVRSHAEQTSCLRNIADVRSDLLKDRKMRRQHEHQ